MAGISIALYYNSNLFNGNMRIDIYIFELELEMVSNLFRATNKKSETKRFNGLRLLSIQQTELQTT